MLILLKSANSCFSFSESFFFFVGCSLITDLPLFLDLVPLVSVFVLLDCSSSEGLLDLFFDPKFVEFDGLFFSLGVSSNKFGTDLGFLATTGALKRGSTN